MAPLLWDNPRPLMTQVLPTALRRLESNWQAWGQPGEDRQVFNSPLPEFAPANLFSDLNLPEVEVVLPQPGSLTPDRVAMPIAQALREFAPGRVSATLRHQPCIRAALAVPAARSESGTDRSAQILGPLRSARQLAHKCRWRGAAGSGLSATGAPSSAATRHSGRHVQRPASLAQPTGRARSWYGPRRPARQSLDTADR